MKLNRLAVISLIAAIVFALPLFASAQNGRPFQALQEQIEALQEQVEALQTGPVKAYVTKNSALNLTDLAPYIDYTVMTLSLPEGKYIYNITIGASYSRPPNFDPFIQTYLDCRFLYDNQEQPGNHLSGMVNGDATHALTTEDELNWNTDVTLVCNHTPFDLPAPQTMTIGSAVWTAIKVGELNRQNIE